MSGFQVDVEGLRKASSAAVSAGEQAGRVQLGSGASAVPAALPGSQSAARAAPLAEAWTKRLGGWSAEVGGFGRDLAAMADRYEADDAAAERDFKSAKWWLGG